MSDIRWWMFDRFERAHLTEHRRDSVVVNALCGLVLTEAYYLCEAGPSDAKCVTCQRAAQEAAG